MRIVLSLSLLTVLSSVLALPRTDVQDSPGSGVASYTNSAAGLKSLLVDMRTAAKSDDQMLLARYIKSSEVPDCGAWLHKMYATDKADSWMGLCEAEARDPRERDLAEMFHRISKLDGEIVTRKVNDNPEPGHGLEWGMLQVIRQGNYTLTSSKAFGRLSVLESRREPSQTAHTQKAPLYHSGF